jgi:hypothetical protein
MSEESKPARLVVQGDAFAWLEANPAEVGMSVVTSLPDISELSQFDLDAWKAWFISTVVRLIDWLPTRGVAIFYQSDIRVRGYWIDKGYLVQRGAEEAGASMLWHKIVCRKPPGTIALGRPSYSHMIALTRTTETLQAPDRTPDVLPDAGSMSWSRAMGVEACAVACCYLIANTAARTIVDPFCGRGTVLAVANALGLNAIGVDIGAKRCRTARALVVDLARERSGR